jgi:vancomycin resistance protein YoaR
MKRLCTVLAIFISCFFLSGFTARAPDIRYFTLYYNNQKIVVTERTLKPQWFNADSHRDFTKGQSIYERAETARNISEGFPEIYKILKRIECEIEVPVFDGHINFNPNLTQKFWVTGATNGIEMDTEAVSREILWALKGKIYADIIIKTREIPHKPESEILSKIGLRGQYSTKFDDDNLPRSANIERSALCFNGLTVMPGEVLSFNSTVGPRTAERGYEEAKIIIDGEFVPGVGGGVCQTSTTLFNAALVSGLTVVKSCNHSLPISYVPLGRDAMVSSAVDLVLKNNTGAPVYFEAGLENGNRVFFKVHGGKLSGRKYKVETEVTEKLQETEVVGDIPADTTGFRKIIIENGYPARTAKTYLEIYEWGKQVSCKLLRKSSYKGKKEIIKYESIPLTHTETIDIIKM